jgi:hypothetical protein
MSFDTQVFCNFKQTIIEPWIAPRIAQAVRLMISSVSTDQKLVLLAPTFFDRAQRWSRSETLKGAKPETGE